MALKAAAAQPVSVSVNETNVEGKDAIRVIKNPAVREFDEPTFANLKIEVKGQQAKLFVNGAKQPALIVNDLKHGPDMAGAVGLWVEVGTEGHFSDLRIRQD